MKQTNITSLGISCIPVRLILRKKYLKKNEQIVITNIKLGKTEYTIILRDIPSNSKWLFINK